MSLSISQNKIDELLQDGAALYAVTSSLLSFAIFSDILPEPLAVSGTMFDFSVFTTDTKERLLDLRRKIVDSQVPLKSEKEIEDEISEMRDRKSR